MNVYGDPHKIEFFGLFVRAIQSVRPDFTGPPMDPPCFPSSCRVRGRLRNESAPPGCRTSVSRRSPRNWSSESGEHLWDWLTNSNPIVATVLGELDLMSDDRGVIREALARMVGERSGGNCPAALTNPINIGIGRSDRRWQLTDGLLMATGTGVALGGWMSRRPAPVIGPQRRERWLNLSRARPRCLD